MASIRPGQREDLAQVPHGATAQRLTWRFLPPPLRQEIERRLGSPVVADDSKDAGFTAGFASLLTGANGAQVFVKAASKVAQEHAVSAYLAEARKLAAFSELPVALPAPRLLWVHQDRAENGWIAVGFEAIEGRPPKRPWRVAELERALDVAEAISEATTPVPTTVPLRPIVEEVPLLRTGWSKVVDRPHRTDALALAQGYADLPPTAFSHSDLRDDNILLGPHGDYAVDWNWPTLAQPWQDTVDLLVSAYGDGLDVEPILTRRRLTRDVDPDHLDGWLAALGGYMEVSSSMPMVANSPHLRTHGRWYAEALWGWLADRRGWS